MARLFATVGSILGTVTAVADTTVKGINALDVGTTMLLETAQQSLEEQRVQRKLESASSLQAAIDTAAKSSAKRRQAIAAMRAESAEFAALFDAEHARLSALFNETETE